MAKQTLTITKLDVDYPGQQAGIHPNGGTIITSFEASKPGGGTLKARYFLGKNDNYVFSDTVRVRPNQPLEAQLGPEDVDANPHRKELRLQKVAGGPRLLKLEIELVVEEIRNGTVVGDGGVPQVFPVTIPSRVTQLLEATGHTQKAFAAQIGVEPHHVSKMKQGKGVPMEVAAQLPDTMEAHMEAQKKQKAGAKKSKPRRKLKVKRKKK